MSSNMITLVGLEMLHRVESPSCFTQNIPTSVGFLSHLMVELVGGALLDGGDDLFLSCHVIPADPLHSIMSRKKRNKQSPPYTLTEHVFSHILLFNSQIMERRGASLMEEVICQTAFSDQLSYHMLN